MPFSPRECFLPHGAISREVLVPRWPNAKKRLTIKGWGGPTKGRLHAPSAFRLRKGFPRSPTANGGTDIFGGQPHLAANELSSSGREFDAKPAVGQGVAPLSAAWPLMAPNPHQHWKLIPDRRNGRTRGISPTVNVQFQLPAPTLPSTPDITCEIAASAESAETFAFLGISLRLTFHVVWVIATGPS